jgi:hypothetical protein
MKKNLLGLVLGVFAFGTLMAAPTFPPDSARQLKVDVLKATGAVTIDGTAQEDDWDELDFYQIDQNKNGADSVDGDYSGQFKLMWDDKGWYLYVEVIDDTIVTCPFETDDEIQKYYYYDYLRMHFSVPSDKVLDSTRTAKGQFHAGTFHLGKAYNPLKPDFNATDTKNGGSWGWTGTTYHEKGLVTAYGNIQGGYSIEQFYPWTLYGLDTLEVGGDTLDIITKGQAGLNIVFDIAIGDQDDITANPTNEASKPAKESWWNNDVESGAAWFIINTDGLLTLQDWKASAQDVAALESKIYPNPANKNITVVAEGLQTVVITNVIGQQFVSKTVNSDATSIDVSNLNSGLYIVTLTSKNGASATQKLVIE